jgi:tetratricopeptide (TPR) repeat protein
MRHLRHLLLLLLGLVLAFGLVGGGLAALGWLRWGDSGWYFQGSADYRLRCGQKALRHGKPERAARVALLLEADGHRDQAALLQGEAFFRQGKADADLKDLARATPWLRKAEAQFTRIRDQGDLRLESVALLGQCYVYLQQLNDARNAFEFVLANQPGHVDAHRGLAVIYFDVGALPRAIMHLEKIAQLDPGDGRPWRLLGLIHKDLKEESLAVACYRQALERDVPGQNPAQIRRELAECLVATGRYAEALDDLRDLDPLPDDVALVEALRGECLAGLGKASEARAVLDQALEQHAGSPELLRARAKLHAAEGEPEGAARLLERALGLDRHDYVSRYQLVQVYQRLGRKADAAEQQRQAEETRQEFDLLTRLNHEAMERPSDAAVRLRLADLCTKLDRPGEAAMWRRAAAGLSSASVRPP